MNYQFCPDMNIAVNTKNDADAAFLRLCADMCEGNIPYSKSAILSAMEHCDDAMAALWVAVGRVMHQESVLVPIGEAASLPSLISNLENRLRARVERNRSSNMREIAAE